jgi:AbrB family looped-hinge helix DNA binding protein
MTSKGQVTIPVVVRAALGIDAGDRVEFIQVDSGRFELIAATHSVATLKGAVRKPSSRVSIAAMNKVIAARGAKAR